MSEDVKKYIGTVFLLTFLLSFLNYFGPGNEGTPGLILLMMQMMLPGLAAIYFIRQEKKSWKEFGFAFGGLKYYLMAYVLIVGFQFVHALTGAVLGLGELLPLRQGLALYSPGKLIPSTRILIVLIFLLNPLQNLLLGFGEEFGWRGYFLQKLLPQGLVYALVVNGVVWGLWHTPLILMGQHFPGAPYLGVAVMVLAAIPLGAIFTWLRLKSGSAVVAGFANGTFKATFFMGGMFYTEASLIFVNPVGLLGIPLLSLLAFALFRFFPVNIEMP